MASEHTRSGEVGIAVYVDFENLALGVQDTKAGRFEIEIVLKRILEKGRIVAKRAYCDWSRYRQFMQEFHRQGFEMIDIPQTKVSGKNSADIRMVVDALDMCYSKAHIDTFVLLTGDSDFSPLVSKLKENDKRVIGCGVRNSTSDLLAANCDEFIFYDDLVRELEAKKKRSARKAPAKPAADAKKAAEPKNEDKPAEERPEPSKREEAIDLVVETVEALVAERGEEEKIWGSMVKQTLKRRKPGFSESYYGYRSFGELLEDAKKRRLLILERDEKSGQHIIRLPADDQAAA